MNVKPGYYWVEAADGSAGTEQIAYVGKDSVETIGVGYHWSKDEWRVISGPLEQPQLKVDGECKGPPCACQSHPGLGPLFNKDGECKGPPCACQSHPGLGPLFNKERETNADPDDAGPHVEKDALWS